MAGFDSSGRLRNQRHERFCRLFVLGNPAFDPRNPDRAPDTWNDRATSYALAGFHPSTRRAARQGAYRLLQRSDVRIRIEELREEERRLESPRLRRWQALLPPVQDLLLKAVAGEGDVTAAQVRAAKVIIRQALGSPSRRFGEREGHEERHLNVTLCSATD